MASSPIRAAMVLLLVCSIGSSSTVSPTSSPPAGYWTPRDSKGNICMRMQFAAEYVVSDEYFDPPKRVVIDPAFATGTSRCESPIRTLRIYPNTEKGPTELWYLELTFTNYSQNYNFTAIEAIAEGSGEYLGSTNFMDIPVTMGYSYNCSQPIFVQITDFNVTIWDMHLQPFAEYSGGNFGPALQCDPQPTNSDSTIIIICSVVGGVILIGLIVAVTAVAVTKHRRRSAYTHIQG